MEGKESRNFGGGVEKNYVETMVADGKKNSRNFCGGIERKQSRDFCGEIEKQGLRDSGSGIMRNIC